jgi:hypothetical protein
MDQKMFSIVAGVIFAAGPPGSTPAGLDRGGNGATVCAAERTAMRRRCISRDSRGGQSR